MSSSPTEIFVFKRENLVKTSYTLIKHIDISLYRLTNGYKGITCLIGTFHINFIL